RQTGAGGGWGGADPPRPGGGQVPLLPGPAPPVPAGGGRGGRPAERRLGLPEDAALGGGAAGGGSVSPPGGGPLRSRLLVLVVLGLALAACALLLVPVVRFAVLGRLRGEPFHDGRPVSYWVDRLERGGPPEREKAAHALGQVGAPTPAIVTALAEA